MAKSFPQLAQIASITASNVDEQNVVVGLRASLDEALSYGVPAIFPEERFTGIVHLNHAAKALAHTCIFAEICVEGLVGHVVSMLEGAVVDVSGVLVVDGIEERWDFPANVVEVVEPARYIINIQLAASG